MPLLISVPSCRLYFIFSLYLGPTSSSSLILIAIWPCSKHEKSKLSTAAWLAAEFISAWQSGSKSEHFVMDKDLMLKWRPCKTTYCAFVVDVNVMSIVTDSTSPVGKNKTSYFSGILSPGSSKCCQGKGRFEPRTLHSVSFWNCSDSSWSCSSWVKLVHLDFWGHFTNS